MFNENENPYHSTAVSCRQRKPDKCDIFTHNKPNKTIKDDKQRAYIGQEIVAVEETCGAEL